LESTILNEVIQQAPTLGVLVFIVWIFLSHLSKMEDRHHIIQRDAISAINENSVALGKNLEALNAVNYTLKRINGNNPS